MMIQSCVAAFVVQTLKISSFMCAPKTALVALTLTTTVGEKEQVFEQPTGPPLLAFPGLSSHVGPLAHSLLLMNLVRNLERHWLSRGAASKTAWSVWRRRRQKDAVADGDEHGQTPERAPRMTRGRPLPRARLQLVLKSFCCRFKNSFLSSASVCSRRRPRSPRPSSR